MLLAHRITHLAIFWLPEEQQGASVKDGSHCEMHSVTTHSLTDPFLSFPSPAAAAAFFLEYICFFFSANVIF